MRCAAKAIGIGLIAAPLVLFASAAQAGGERVTFPSNDVDKTRPEPTALAGILFRPQGSGPFPAVVLLHGCGGLFTRSGDVGPRERFWQETLVAQGYVVLFVDSFTPRHVQEVCTMQKQTVSPNFHRNRDAYGALRYRQGRPDVYPGRIAAMGWSHGGNTTLAAVNRTTASRPRDLPRGDFRAAVAYPGCEIQLHDPKWGTEVPLLILSGEKDNWTPAQPCIDLEARMKPQHAPFELIVYPGAYHDLDWPTMPLRTRSGVNFTRGGSAMMGTNPEGRADAIKLVTVFLGERLKP